MSVAHFQKCCSSWHEDFVLGSSEEGMIINAIFVSTLCKHSTKLIFSRLLINCETPFVIACSAMKNLVSFMRARKRDINVCWISRGNIAASFHKDMPIAYSSPLKILKSKTSSQWQHLHFWDMAVCQQFTPNAGKFPGKYRIIYS